MDIVNELVGIVSFIMQKMEYIYFIRVLFKFTHTILSKNINLKPSPVTSEFE